jgi:hypothetical protein
MLGKSSGRTYSRTYDLPACTMMVYPKKCCLIYCSSSVDYLKKKSQKTSEDTKLIVSCVDGEINKEWQTGQTEQRESARGICVHRIKSLKSTLKSCRDGIVDIWFVFPVLGK